MPAKRVLEFQEITQAIRDTPFPHCDLVVGIGSGGVVPASLIAFHLGKPLRTIRVNYRDADNRPRHAAPQLISPVAIPAGIGTILLVDDVSVSGKTLGLVKKLLANYSVTTVVMKGSADFALFPDITTCVQWPWSSV